MSSHSLKEHLAQAEQLLESLPAIQDEGRMESVRTLAFSTRDVIFAVLRENPDVSVLERAHTLMVRVREHVKKIERYTRAMGEAVNTRIAVIEGKLEKRTANLTSS